MTAQNYCMIDEATNVCMNTCLWDGDPNTWTPPAGYLMLVQATTPARLWAYDYQAMSWGLAVVMGEGQIGFTWDGTYLTTPDPEPPAPVLEPQPTVTGAQTL